MRRPSRANGFSAANGTISGGRRPQLPTRQLIDDVTNATPVFVTRYDGHMALANSAALGRAGITESTPDPPGGAIVRDANGYPTGVLKDAAMEFVARVIPKMTPDQRLARREARARDTPPRWG